MTPTLPSKVMIVPIAEGPGSQPLLGHGSTIFSFFDVCAAQNLIGLSVGFAQLQLDNKNIRFLHNKNASTIYVFRSLRPSLPSHRKRTSGYIVFVLG